MSFWQIIKIDLGSEVERTRNKILHQRKNLWWTIIIVLGLEVERTRNSTASVEKEEFFADNQNCLGLRGRTDAE